MLLWMNILIMKLCFLCVEDEYYRSTRIRTHAHGCTLLFHMNLCHKMNNCGILHWYFRSNTYVIIEYIHIEVHIHYKFNFTIQSESVRYVYQKIKLYRHTNEYLVRDIRKT